MLEKAVIKQLGYRTLSKDCKETLADVSRHGADSGYSGFTYYTDTAAFFDENREAILESLEEMASEVGGDPIKMICNFNCLKAMNLKTTEVAKVLYGKGDTDEATQIKNALAWFALETVAMRFDA